MDVERVQKINNLALELMKQGLIKDREEAVKQAERILAKKDCSSLGEAVNEVKEMDLNMEKVEEELSKEKIKEILEKNTIFIVKKMNGYQEQMEELKKEISELKKELSGIRYDVVNLPKEQPLKEAVKAEPQQKLEAGKNNNSTEDHPRSGSYNNVDVSIEKFFYSGSKAKD